MSLGVWIAVGLFTGFLASKLVIKTGDGLLLDVGVGIAGAVIAGWLFRTFGAADPVGLTVSAFLVSIAGASTALVAYHRFFPRTEPAKPSRPSRRAGARVR
jgi:uncharacterized membrane protein YeaQ/YmgE (transglycosylase-associated protein family)